MPVCQKCHADKDQDDFYTDPNRPSGYHPWCKKCGIKNTKQWIARKRSTPEGRKYFADLARRGSYGLTAQEYEERFAAQEGLCAICQQVESSLVKGQVRNLSVDHVHETGAIRGLLCDRCNRGIGFFKDNPTLLRAAADYLEGGVS